MACGTRRVIVVLVQGDLDTLLAVKDKAGIDIVADELLAEQGKVRV
jgi:hypothetical protein